MTKIITNVKVFEVDNENNNIFNYENEDDNGLRDTNVYRKRKKKSVAPKVIIVIAAVLVALTALALFLPFGVLSTPLDRDGMVMKIGDYEVMADEYRYAALPVRDYFLQSYPQYFEEMGEQQFFSVLEKSLKQEIAVYNWAIEEGFGLTEEEEASVDAYMNDEKSYYGSEEEYQSALSSYYLNEALYRKHLVRQTVTGKFNEYLYSKSEYATVNEADIASFASENEVVHYEILGILTSEDEAVNAQKKQLAEKIAAALAEDPSRFHELQEQYNEDPMADSYPNGMTSINGSNILGYQMDATLVETINSLAIGQVSEAMQFSDGFYFFYRSDMVPEDLRDYIVQGKVNEAIALRAENEKIEYGYGYDRITIENLTPKK